MIQNDQEARLVREQLERARDALHSIERDLKPRSLARFELIAENYQEEIQKLESLLDDYEQRSSRSNPKDNHDPPGGSHRNGSIPIQPVDKPIICSPYDEPAAHWEYDKKSGAATKIKGRRRAGYWYKTQRTGTAETPLLFSELEEDWDDLPLVNLLREDVKRWREADYRGASSATRDLLRHWASPLRPRRLFYCQREAVETIIYLAELRLPGKSTRTGFKNFALTEEILSRLLRGEPPELDLVSPRYFPTLIDRPHDPDLLPLRRLGCKMATGSGKTVVMAMLISWAFCNRGLNPSSTEFPSAVLVCCPNLTVKERLQVLRPDHEQNYYEFFDLVPVKYRSLLQAGKVLIENWHRFAPESEHKEGDKSYAVVNKGPETPETLARRVLGDLYERMPILVLNDEGHHCWRPAPGAENLDEILGKYRRGGKGRKKELLSKEEETELKEEAAEARVWLEGLDFINQVLRKDRPGISFCVDLSATPFYLRGSGYPEGQPFPWLVSDFGLVDAIESGIVKIPRLPVKDTAEKKDEVGRPDPQYFRLWHRMQADLPKGQKHASGKPKAEAAYAYAEGALKQIAGQWVERFEDIQKANPRDQAIIPPVLIVVCDNTDIAEEFYRKISGETVTDHETEQDVEDIEAGDDEDKVPKGAKAKGKKVTVHGQGAVFPEYFSNTPDCQYTIRIDVKKLRDAESEDPAKSRQEAAEELRRVVATVGKKGEPGEHVRCVVSVSMLTEGWDANNVTNILGVRAFGSQLLCEQVVGRGLRRRSYEPDPATGLLTEEYVDVYGIPFSVIPFKGRPTNQAAPEDKPQHRVWALPDREEMELRFPSVEGYVFALKKNLIRCEVGKIEPLRIDSKLEPIATFVRPTAGYLDTQTLGPQQFDFIQQDRATYYGKTHFQAILFQITQRIIDDLLSPAAEGADRKARALSLQARHQLFPQVHGFVQEYIRTKVDFNGVDRRELGLEKYLRLVVERIREAILPDESAGEPPLLPILHRYRPRGRTGGVDFPTTRPVSPTIKSHLNLVVQHSDWEAEAAKVLDESVLVKCHARNYHLGLQIPYEYMGQDHTYEPDFLVRLVNDLNLLLEIKGFEVHGVEQTQAKHNSARKWVTAVNNLGDFGRWDFLVCREVSALPAQLAPFAGK